ncbi:MAG: redoxin domain-containing protein [Phycisphaerales bacterium]|nr:redoxin domain-containing protein [Phycisphaerales bacterium]
MRRRTSLTVLAVSLFAVSPLTADVIREGTGSRRDQLNAMELAKFPASAWAGLADWSGGPALTPESMSVKPVLIVTWASWYPVSINQGLKPAQEMAAKYADKGLVVVGIHHDQGWDKAAAAAAQAGAKFAIARDVGGAFRTALKVDQDPDFYVIDRSGNLRFADIATASLEEAVKTVVSESAQDAADAPKFLSDREARARADALRQQAIRSEIELGSLPDVPPGFTPPPAEAYEAIGVHWPRIPEEWGKKVGLLDQTTGKFTPTTLAVSPSGWQPKMPIFDGRAVVVYLWNPQMPDTFRAFDVMDRLQQKYVRDLVVVGAYTPLAVLQNNSGYGQPQDSEEEQAKRLNNFIRSRTFRHTLAADFGASVLNSLPQGARTDMPVPLGVIASSEGTIRYIGSADDPNFEAQVASILAVDPGVRARRAADEKFIGERQK